MWWYLLLAPACAALVTREPPAPPARAHRNDESVTEGWAQIRLHHFDATITDTFNMRYFYNNEFTNGSDIVIFVGGEWSISPGWVQAGLPYQLAEALGAGLFYTEHRYYGQTRPTPDTSVSELRFLTVDQALADLAQFIQYVKSEDFEGGRFRNGAVILIGCSYAGSMATWMRLAYPHLITAAYSDSGPLHAQEDFPEYLEMITRAIREQGGQECHDRVSEAVLQLIALMGTTNGPTQVSTLFNTCTNINAQSMLDLATFYWFGIQETFAYLVQYATPGDIPAMCQVLADTSIGTEVERLASWITSHPWIVSQGCIETRYTEVVQAHTNTSYDSLDAVMRLWTYQTCVEYGWYQTTSGVSAPVRDAVPLEFFHQMCRDFFSTAFDEARLRSGIERTNILFAGLTHLPDRVVSVQGGHDPWSPMGPNATHAHYLAPVYVVPEASHCMALGSLGSTDIPQVESTKRAVLNHLHLFVTGEPFDSSASSLAASIVALGVFVALWL